MKNLKSMLILSVVFILGFSASAIGEITYKDITIELRGITINVNGTKTESELEPFIYKDRTWVPVAFVSKSLGKFIEWDGTTNTVGIWDKKPENSTPPPEEDESKIMVYVTDTGKKYHRSTCMYLDESKIAVSLKEAKTYGYTPCGKCHPAE